MESSGKLEEKLQQFSKEQLKTIYKNVVDIELTEGCSNGCDYCPFNDGSTEITDIIDFSTMEFLAEKVVKYRKKDGRPLSLWKRTDPLNYSNKKKNYFDVLNLFEGIETITITSVPEGKQELAVKNLDKINRISNSHMNRDRLANYFDDLNIQVMEGYIDEKGDVNVEVAEPNSKTPFINSNKKDYHETHEKFRFCAPIEGIKGNYIGQKVVDMDYVETFSLNGGLSKEGNNRRVSHSGLMITPKGIFNSYATEVTKENPTGMILEEVDPNNFKIQSRRDHKKYIKLE